MVSIQSSAGRHWMNRVAQRVVAGGSASPGNQRASLVGLLRRNAIPALRAVVAVSGSVGRLIACALLTSGVAACSTAAPAPDKADLERSVHAWWSARQAGDITTMYSMYEPSFRATTSLSQFAVEAGRLRRVAVENPRIVTVSPIPNSNRVVVTLVAQTLLPKAG